MSKVTISPETTQKLYELLQEANYNSNNIAVIDWLITSDCKLFLFMMLKASDVQTLEECVVLELSESSVNHLLDNFDDLHLQTFDDLIEANTNTSLFVRLNCFISFTKGWIYSTVRFERRAA